jgi:hypothetical protein
MEQLCYVEFILWCLSMMAGIIPLDAQQSEEHLFYICDENPCTLITLHHETYS